MKILILQSCRGISICTYSCNDPSLVCKAESSKNAIKISLVILSIRVLNPVLFNNEFPDDRIFSFHHFYPISRNFITPEIKNFVDNFETSILKHNSSRVNNNSRFLIE